MRHSISRYGCDNCGEPRSSLAYHGESDDCMGSEDAVTAEKQKIVDRNPGFPWIALSFPKPTVW
jgi:hypothetical protein